MTTLKPSKPAADGPTEVPTFIAITRIGYFPALSILGAKGLNEHDLDLGARILAFAWHRRPRERGLMTSGWCGWRRVAMGYVSSAP